MDIIHHLSNLELETTYSSSSQEEVEVEEEEEVTRNWLELPPEVMSLILLKLGAVNILMYAQWVCISWWKLSKQPHLFHSINVDHVLASFGCRGISKNATIWEGLAREAIDRSCGQLVEFSVRYIANDGLLHYMSNKTSSLRCIRFVSCDKFSHNGMIEMAKKLPQLEELEMIQCWYFSKDVFETFGRFCPRLKYCRINYVNCSSSYVFNGVPVAIAQNMPELRYLNLFGNKFLTDDGLIAVLDGCPHLELLDLSGCFDLKFAGDLKERCGNIKVIRLPYDFTDDFEYELQPYPFSGYSEYDSDDDKYGVYSGIDYDDDDDSYVYNEKIYGSDD